MIWCKYCNTHHEDGTFFNLDGKCSIELFRERQYQLNNESKQIVNDYLEQCVDATNALHGGGPPETGAKPPKPKSKDKTLDSFF